MHTDGKRLTAAGAVLSTGAAVWLIGWLVIMMAEGSFVTQIRTALMIVGLQIGVVGLVAHYLATREGGKSAVSLYTLCLNGLVGLTTVILGLVGTTNVFTEFPANRSDRQSLATNQELWGTLLSNMGVVAAAAVLLIVSAWGIVGHIESRANRGGEAAPQDRPGGFEPG